MPPVIRPDIDNRVNPTALQTGGHDTSVSGAGQAVGAAVGRAGEVLSAFADNKFQSDQRYDVAAAKKADVAALADISKVNQSILSSKGFDAVQARSEGEQEIERIKKHYLDQLTTEGQRSLFADVFDTRIITDRAKHAEHEEKQIYNAEINQSKARQQAYSDRAVDSRGTPEDVEAALATAENELRFQLRGQGEDLVREAVRAQRSDVFARSAEAIRIGNGGDEEGDAIAADEYITQHSDELTPEDQTKLRQRNAPALFEQRLDGFLGMVFEAQSSQPTEEGGPAKGDPKGHSHDDNVKQRESAVQYHGDPLRGRGRDAVQGGKFGAARSGGKRKHGGHDFPAKAGTPIYPPSDGKVHGEPYWTDQGGWQIRIKHANGRITGYAHLQSKPKLKAGAAVGKDSIIGAVGNTGIGTGPHLHYTVTAPNGKTKVDPQSVKWEEGELPVYSGERKDKQSLYDAARGVATRENLSPKMYDALLRRIDTEVAREDNLRSRRIQADEDEAYKILADLGDGLVRESQIPNFGDLSPRMQISIRGAIRENTRPDPVQAGGAEYWKQYIDAQTKIADGRPEDIDPTAWGRMTAGERQRLLGLYVNGTLDKNDPRNKKNKGPKVGSIFTVANRYSAAAGYNKGSNMSEKDRNKQGKFISAIEDEVAERIARGEEVGDKELDQIARGLVIETTITDPNGGFFGRGSSVTKPRYLRTEEERTSKDLTRTVNIPKTESSRISQAFERATGRKPTLREITEIYIDSGGVR